MPAASLNNDSVLVDDGLQSIVCIKELGDLPGGRTLDVSDVPSDVKFIKAGHILIQDDESGDISPLGITTDADNANKKVYVDLPDGKSYIGVLKASILVKDPRAAILTAGQINAAASPFPVTDAIVKGLPLVQFLYRA